jgi:hypothetical protein
MSRRTSGSRGSLLEVTEDIQGSDRVTASAHSDIVVFGVLPGKYECL